MSSSVWNSIREFLQNTGVNDLLFVYLLSWSILPPLLRRCFQEKSQLIVAEHRAKQFQPEVQGLEVFRSYKIASQNNKRIKRQEIIFTNCGSGGCAQGIGGWYWRGTFSSGKGCYRRRAGRMYGRAKRSGLQEEEKRRKLDTLVLCYWHLPALDMTTQVLKRV